MYVFGIEWILDSRVKNNKLQKESNQKKNIAGCKYVRNPVLND